MYFTITTPRAKILHSTGVGDYGRGVRPRFLTRFGHISYFSQSLPFFLFYLSCNVVWTTGSIELMAWEALEDVIRDGFLDGF